MLRLHGKTFCKYQFLLGAGFAGSGMLVQRVGQETLKIPSKQGSREAVARASEWQVRLRKVHLGDPDLSSSTRLRFLKLLSIPSPIVFAMTEHRAFMGYGIFP